MSARLNPSLAEQPDDDALRELLASNPVAGTMTLTYTMEPSYFAATALLGEFAQTIVGRDDESGRLGAIACRSIRPRYVDGALRPVGYLSGLRVDGPSQGRWIVSRGLAYLRELDRDGRAEVYLATIVAGADAAKGVLVDRVREGHPTFVALGQLLTFALPTRRRRGPATAPRGVEVRAATRAELPDIAAFLAEAGAKRRFFPAFSEADLAGETPQGAGLAEGDVFAARRDGHVVGSVLLWDQRSRRQAIVNSYSDAVERSRPMLTLVARALGSQPLPEPGESIAMAYGALLAIEGDDAAVARALLGQAAREAARRGIGLLMVGMTADDPLLPAVQGRPRITYRSTVYAVGWDGAAERLASLGQERPLHVEIAML